MALNSLPLVDLTVRADGENFLGDLNVLPVDPLLLELPYNGIVGHFRLQCMEVTRLR